MERKFSECRIQGHSSGRAGGISHQGDNLEQGKHMSDHCSGEWNNGQNIP